MNYWYPWRIADEGAVVDLQSEHRTRIGKYCRQTARIWNRAARWRFGVAISKRSAKLPPGQAGRCQLSSGDRNVSLAELGRWFAEN